MEARMAKPAQHPVTAEELLEAGGRYRYGELVRGVLRISEPPNAVHGWLATRIASRLIIFVEQHRLGVVMVETGYILQRNPDTVRGPDVSFVSATRMPPTQIPERYIEGAPDLAVEILSPNDRWRDVEEKLADYFAAGTRLVWLVDPRQRRVVVRHPDRAPRIIDANGALDGEDVVPGFRCALGEIFGAR
jgi:Uma2 family endonuclease